MKHPPIERKKKPVKKVKKKGIAIQRKGIAKIRGKVLPDMKVGRGCPRWNSVFIKYVCVMTPIKDKGDLLERGKMIFNNRKWLMKIVEDMNLFTDIKAAKTGWQIDEVKKDGYKMELMPDGLPKGWKKVGSFFKRQKFLKEGGLTYKITKDKEYSSYNIPSMSSHFYGHPNTAKEIAKDFIGYANGAYGHDRAGQELTKYCTVGNGEDKKHFTMQYGYGPASMKIYLGYFPDEKRLFEKYDKDDLIVTFTVQAHYTKIYKDSSESCKDFNTRQYFRDQNFAAALILDILKELKKGRDHFFLEALSKEPYIKNVYLHPLINLIHDTCYQ